MTFFHKQPASDMNACFSDAARLSGAAARRMACREKAAMR